MYCKWINEYEGLYKIYIDGTIERYYQNGKTRILKHNNNKCGYKLIDLYKNSKRKTLKIHRLLAIHFIVQPDNCPIVDHIDRNPLNNNLENLRWTTYSINCRNKRNTGRYLKGVSKNKKGNKYQSKITIDRKLKHLGSFNTELEAHNCYMIEYNKIMNEFS